MASRTSPSVSLSDSVMVWPLIEKVWPCTLLSPKTESIDAVVAGAAEILVSGSVPPAEPLVRTLELASCWMSMLKVPSMAVPSEAAVPRLVLESAAVCEVKREGEPSAAASR